MALLTLQDIVAGYGNVQVLHGLSLAVAPGSITALVGANGAGKTTTMRAIAGLIETRAGVISFDGKPLGETSTSARVDAGIALVPEGRLVFPTLSVEENLRLGAIVPRARPHVARRRDEMFALFPRLAERRKQAAGSLSGGEQQMLAIARGLMAGPRLLLLDEPTLGLAPLMVELVFDTVRKLRAGGLTILIAEQDVRRTLEVADAAYVIENGRVAFDGAGAILLGDERVKIAYLGL